MADSSLNPPKQDRSRRTLERMVRASIQILEDEGPAGLTVQSIVAKAGASVGSFYARFAGKDDLLDYLGERVWREAAERWDRSLAGEDWSALDLRGAARASVRLLDASGRSRATILRALGSASGAAGDAFAAFQQHVLDGLERLLAERTEGGAHPEPALAARLGLRAVVGVLGTPVDADGEADEDGTVGRLTAERRATEAERILVGYLAGDTGGALADDGQIDFFDVWG